MQHLRARRNPLNFTQCSLSPMPNFPSILIEHHRCLRSALPQPHIASPENDAISRLWSDAKVRPLQKVHIKSAGSNGNVSYHIPAASSIEIEFSTRAAVSSAIKVHHASPAQLYTHLSPHHAANAAAAAVTPPRSNHSCILLLFICRRS